MKLFCIWGETRADIQRGYEVVTSQENPPQRITWRLVSQFDGKPVGNECYAPDHAHIQDAYGPKDKPKAKSKKSKKT